MKLLENAPFIRLNLRIPLNLMDLFEQLSRGTNNFAKGDMKMQVVKIYTNQRLASLKQQPPNVQLIFNVPDCVYHRRFEIPLVILIEEIFRD